MQFKETRTTLVNIYYRVVGNPYEHRISDAIDEAAAAVPAENYDRIAKAGLEAKKKKWDHPARWSHGNRTFKCPCRQYRAG